MVLLHATAFFTTKVEIPQLKLETAKKLAPVTFANVIGLVFNILCLRGVEASYFQASTMRPPYPTSSLTTIRRLLGVLSSH